MLILSKIYQLGQLKDVDVHSVNPEDWENTYGARWSKQFGKATFKHQLVCECPGHANARPATSKRAPKKEEK